MGGWLDESPGEAGRGQDEGSRYLQQRPRRKGQKAAEYRQYQLFDA